jgi:hypothetical protein
MRPPIGKEILLAMGTEVYHRNVRCLHTLIQQLVYIRLPQIKTIFSDMERMRKKHIIPKSSLLEFFSDILSDFITIFSYARTESDQQG